MKESIISEIQGILIDLNEHHSHVFIKEEISVNGENFNRHFTASSGFELKLQSVGVRTSGAVMMLDGFDASYEIRTGNIYRIERQEFIILIYENLGPNIVRKSEFHLHKEQYEVPKINVLLHQLQFESTNSGGHYRFEKLPVNTDYLMESLKEYINSLIKEKIDNINESNYDQAIKGLQSLQLKKHSLKSSPIKGKLLYWRDHRTSLDHRKTITDRYEFYEKLFLEKMNLFLDYIGVEAIYEIVGIDTYYSIGQDHVNEDIIIAGEKGVYLLHFGWSS